MVVTPISEPVDASAPDTSGGRANSVVNNTAGAPLQLLAVSWDITQARPEETRRLQEEARVRFALTSA